MVIILKIILSLFILVGFVVAKTLYKDFKETEKTQDYEDIIIADKIKMKIILYFSLITIISFCLLLLYYVIVPIQITNF